MVGGLSALAVLLGFGLVSLSDDGEGLAGAVSLALVLLGSAGLLLGPLCLQLREAVHAMRGDRSPAHAVLTVTIATCGAATVVFIVGFLSLKLARGDDVDGVSWADLPSAGAFFVPWLYALVSALVVIAVVETAERVRRRRR